MFLENRTLLCAIHKGFLGLFLRLAVGLGYTREPVEKSRHMKAEAARGDCRLEVPKAASTGSVFASPSSSSFLATGLVSCQHRLAAE